MSSDSGGVQVHRADIIRLRQYTGTMVYQGIFKNPGGIIFNAILNIDAPLSI